MQEFMRYSQEVIALRRDFHMHPELGFEEHRTSGIVEDYLRDLGLDVRRMAGTGVVAELNNGGKRRIALRADMDALPIQEENDMPYRSRIPGRMHACGHDAHTAMLLVAAKILSGMDFEGKIRFIFQPAEEGLNGALRMVEDGAIEGVDAILGIHVWADLPSGQIAISPGPVLANVDRFLIKVIGQGGHGASPHQTRDPIVAAASIVMGLQTIVSRNVKPLESAVVTVGRISGGTAFNIIPEEVILEGTARSFDEEIHSILEERVIEISQRMAESLGCHTDVDFQRLNYATVNDETLANVCREVASEFMQVVEQERNMGGEDFSEYSRRIPGLFAFLGIRNEEKGIVHPHHSPKFDVDEDALIYGVAFEVKASVALLDRLG